MPDMPDKIDPDLALYSAESGIDLPTFQVAVNRNYHDKIVPGDGRFWKFNMTFETQQLTLPQLLVSIRQGYAWSAPTFRSATIDLCGATPITSPPTG